MPQRADGRPSLKPTRKVTGAGGAFAIVLVWTLGQFGIDMLAEVGAASATLLAFGLGWLVRESS